MSMSADLRDRLKAADVAAGGVFRDERPQGFPPPAVVLLVVSDPRPTTYDEAPQLRETRVQADCQGGSRGAADELAEAVITAATPAGVVGGTRFSRSFVIGSRSYSDRPQSGEVVFVTSLDLAVWHQPAS